MRNYNVIFKADNVGNIFRYPANEPRNFRLMRGFALTACNGLNPVFTTRLVDLFDDIKEMQAGAEMYVITSEREVITADNLDAFNRKVERWEYDARIDPYGCYGDDAPKYMPNDNTAFKVRRTPKMWILTTLHSEVRR